MGDDLRRLLRRTARAAEDRPSFLAATFARYRAIEQIDALELARLLSVAPVRLDELAICLRPRADHFREDVAAVAARFGADAGALAAIVREVDAFDAIAEAIPANPLAAARDADEDGPTPEDES
jgi:hypothetical protein